MGLVLAVALAYAGSLRGAFLFDDPDSITANPTLRHLGDLRAVLSPPGDGATVQGRPLLNLSLAVNYAIGGPSVLGYHLTNTAIHAGAALLLFGIVRRTLRDDAVAFAAALLWAVHPLHTESVTYVVQRAESLMGLCFFLTLYAFIRAAAAPRAATANERPGSAARSGRGWGAISVLACLAGALTKEVIAVAPVLVLAYDATFLSESWRAALARRKRYYAALAATWIPLGALILTAGGRGHTVGLGLARPAWQYWLTQFPAILTYLRLAFWPAPLIFDRTYDLRWVTEPIQVLPYALVALLLLARTAAELRRRTAVGFLGLWFFAVLAPTSLVPGYLQTMAEHRMYLALAPLTVLFAALVFHFAGRAPAWGRSAALALCLALAAALGAGTAARNRDYRSERAMWTDAVAKQPENPIAEYNLGNTELRDRDYRAAIAHFRAAIAVRPGLPLAHNNLGTALVSLGDAAGGAAEFAAAIRLDPEYAGPHNNLANLFAHDGRFADAVREYEEALRLDPSYDQAKNNLRKVQAAMKASPALHP